MPWAESGLVSMARSIVQSSRLKLAVPGDLDRCAVHPHGDVGQVQVAVFCAPGAVSGQRLVGQHFQLQGGCVGDRQFGGKGRDVLGRRLASARKEPSGLALNSIPLLDSTLAEERTAQLAWLRFRSASSLAGSASETSHPAPSLAKRALAGEQQRSALCQACIVVERAVDLVHTSEHCLQRVVVLSRHRVKFVVMAARSERWY